MKFYDFLDKEPPIGKLVVIEGTERVLADRALEVLLDRLLPADVRDLNLARFTADEAGDAGRVREALQAMPFLAERRVVVVTETQTMRADPRARSLGSRARRARGQHARARSICSRRARKGPQPFGVMAGRAALRIDTTAGEETRARFVRRDARAARTRRPSRASIDELARSERRSRRRAQRSREARARPGRTSR